MGVSPLYCDSWLVYIAPSQPLDRPTKLTKQALIYVQAAQSTQSAALLFRLFLSCLSGSSGSKLLG